jgi:hypothetical protein
MFQQYSRLLYRPLVTIRPLEIGTASEGGPEMSEQELDFLGRTVKGTPDPAEIRLIAELTDCHEDSLSKRHAFSHPPQSVLADGYKEMGEFGLCSGSLLSG